MGLWCQPSKTAEGEGTSWGTVEPASILGPQGWCNAAQPEAFCECYLDGGWVGGWVGGWYCRALQATAQLKQLELQLPYSNRCPGSAESLLIACCVPNMPPLLLQATEGAPATSLTSRWVGAVGASAGGPTLRAHAAWLKLLAGACAKLCLPT